MDESDLGSPILRLDKTRTLLIKEKIKNPSITLKELSKRMLSEYGIKISHSRIADILREMKSNGVMREVVIPNENYFIFAFIEFSSKNENFKDWIKTYEFLKKSPNVILILLVDGNRRWKVLGAFRSFREVTRWLHEFAEKNGKELDTLDLSIVYKIHKFSFPHQLVSQDWD